MLDSTSLLSSELTDCKLFGKSNCEIYFNSILILLCKENQARSTAWSISVKTLLVLGRGSPRQIHSQDPNCGLGSDLAIVGC